MEKRSSWKKFCSLLVAKDGALRAYRPAVFLGDKESVEMSCGVTVLPDPGSPLVRRAQNDAAVSDDPTILIIGEIHAHEIDEIICRDALPCEPAVLGSEDHSFLADHVAFLIVPKIYIEERETGFGVLKDPRVPAVYRGKDHAVVTDDPAVGTPVIVQMKQLAF